MNNRIFIYPLTIFSFFVCSNLNAQTKASDIAAPLQKIKQLQPKQFENNAGSQPFGFTAGNMKEVFPQLVKEKNQSYMFGKNSYRNAKVTAIDEAGLIPVLVAAVKQQQEEIEYLKAELIKLKKETAGR